MKVAEGALYSEAIPANGIAVRYTVENFAITKSNADGLTRLQTQLKATSPDRRGLPVLGPVTC
jgi:hypothetical protein